MERKLSRRRRAGVSEDLKKSVKQKHTCLFDDRDEVEVRPFGSFESVRRFETTEFEKSSEF